MSLVVHVLLTSLVRLQWIRYANSTSTLLLGCSAPAHGLGFISCCWCSAYLRS